MITENKFLNLNLLLKEISGQVWKTFFIVFCFKEIKIDFFYIEIDL